MCKLAVYVVLARGSFPRAALLDGTATLIAAPRQPAAVAGAAKGEALTDPVQEEQTDPMRAIVNSMIAARAHA